MFVYYVISIIPKSMLDGFLIVYSWKLTSFMQLGHLLWNMILGKQRFYFEKDSLATFTRSQFNILHVFLGIPEINNNKNFYWTNLGKILKKEHFFLSASLFTLTLILKLQSPIRGLMRSGEYISLFPNH